MSIRLWPPKCSCVPGVVMASRQLRRVVVGLLAICCRPILFNHTFAHDLHISITQLQCTAPRTTCNFAINLGPSKSAYPIGPSSLRTKQSVECSILVLVPQLCELQRIPSSIPLCNKRRKRKFFAADNYLVFHHGTGKRLCWPTGKHSKDDCERMEWWNPKLWAP